MNPVPAAYVEHVAFYVKDIPWHVRFFEDVLALGVRKIRGPAEAPINVMLYGGIQLFPLGEAGSPESAMAHVGLMVESLPEARKKLSTWDVSCEEREGKIWVHLPDGMILELMQAQPGVVADYFEVKSRL